MIRRLLLSVADSEGIRDMSTSLPVARDVVARFVAGDDLASAVSTARDLVGRGLTVSIDRLGEDVTDMQGAAETRDDYLDLLDALAEADLTADAEVSIKLSAMGQALPNGEAVALDHAHNVCEKAASVGTKVTLDMEDHTTIDSTLEVLRTLRADFPWVGAVLQAYLFRTEADARDLAAAGSRVRLVKGAYREPESVAYQDPHDVDLAYVRCLKILMHGASYPMIATHDPRLIEIARAVATHADRERGSYEFQMLLGVRPEEQQRLSDDGETVRVYVPYGQDWYGYLMRRMAEKPGNLALFLKALSSKK